MSKEFYREYAERYLSLQNEVWAYVDRVRGRDGSSSNVRAIYRLFGLGNVGKYVQHGSVQWDGAHAELVAFKTRSALVLGGDSMVAHVALAASIHPAPAEDLAALGSALILSGVAILTAHTGDPRTLADYLRQGLFVVKTR